MSETTGTYEPGTRASAVLLIKAAADAVAELDNEATSEADAAAGLVVIDHVVRLASAHALLAIETRLGELAERLGEAAALLRPRSVDLGPFGVVHNPNGLTADEVAAAFDRASAFAKARQTGHTPTTPTTKENHA